MQGGPASTGEPVASNDAESRFAATNGLFGDLQARVRASTGEEILLPEELGPISPELVLVSPPEIARLARELLPDLPLSYGSLSREGVVPLPAAPVPAEQARPRGLMDASLEPPYTLREVVRGTTALALAAALFAAAAFAADRAVERSQPSIASPGPARTATPPRSGVAGVSISRHIGVGAGGSGRAAARREARPKPATHTALRPSKPAASSGGQPSQQVVIATGSAGKAPGTTPARPPASKPRTTPSAPSAGSGTFVPSRVFAWAATPGARAYEVRFLLDGKPVLVLHPARPQLTLPAGFHFRAGTYRWHVAPVLASGKLGAPLVDSSFRLTAATAARANSGAR